MENETNLNRWVDDRLSTLGPAPEWQPDMTRALGRLRQREAAMSRQRQWKWAAAAAFAGVSTAGVLAFPPARAFAGRCVAACVGETARVRDVLWPDSATVHRTGNDRRLAPDFTLKDASGRDVQLADLRGKVVLLNFWATWCRPCTIEIPWFSEFQRTYKDSGLEVLGVSLDEEGWEVVRPFLQRAKVNYRVVVGGDDIARLYGGVESLPTTLILDRSGRIIATHTGLVDRERYESEIRSALAER
jgi:cytochrome c biogenesis protein CcmG/thiol:disulfide interchange protein DsbE